MSTLKGIIRNGQVIVIGPTDLPEGTEVEILPVGLPAVDDSGEMTADEIARTLAAMENIEPFEMTDEKRAAIEADREARKEREKAQFDEHGPAPEHLRMSRFLLDTGVAGEFINRRRGIYEHARHEVARGNRVGIWHPGFLPNSSTARTKQLPRQQYTEAADGPFRLEGLAVRLQSVSHGPPSREERRAGYRAARRPGRPTGAEPPVTRSDSRRFSTSASVALTRSFPPTLDVPAASPFFETPCTATHRGGAGACAPDGWRPRAARSSWRPRPSSRGRSWFSSFIGS